jgi:hypothetical protein
VGDRYVYGEESFEAWDLTRLIVLCRVVRIALPARLTQIASKDKLALFEMVQLATHQWLVTIRRKEYYVLHILSA